MSFRLFGAHRTSHLEEQASPTEPTRNKTSEFEEINAQDTFQAAAKKSKKLHTCDTLEDAKVVFQKMLSQHVDLIQAIEHIRGQADSQLDDPHGAIALVLAGKLDKFAKVIWEDMRSLSSEKPRWLNAQKLDNRTLLYILLAAVLKDNDPHLSAWLSLDRDTILARIREIEEVIKPNLALRIAHFGQEKVLSREISEIDFEIKYAESQIQKNKSRILGQQERKDAVEKELHELVNPPKTLNPVKSIKRVAHPKPSTAEGERLTKRYLAIVEAIDDATTTSANHAAKIEQLVKDRQPYVQRLARVMEAKALEKQKIAAEESKIAMLKCLLETCRSQNDSRLSAIQTGVREVENIEGDIERLQTVDINLIENIGKLADLMSLYQTEDSWFSRRKIKSELKELLKNLGEQ